MNTEEKLRSLLQEYVGQDECICHDADLEEGTCLFCMASQMLNEVQP